MHWHRPWNGCITPYANNKIALKSVQCGSEGYGTIYSHDSALFCFFNTHLGCNFQHIVEFLYIWFSCFSSPIFSQFVFPFGMPENVRFSCTLWRTSTASRWDCSFRLEMGFCLHNCANLLMSSTVNGISGISSLPGAGLYNLPIVLYFCRIELNFNSGHGPYFLVFSFILKWKFTCIMYIALMQRPAKSSLL